MTLNEPLHRLSFDNNIYFPYFCLTLVLLPTIAFFYQKINEIVVRPTNLGLELLYKLLNFSFSLDVYI